MLRRRCAPYEGGMRDFDIAVLALLYDPGIDCLNDPRLTVTCFLSIRQASWCKPRKGEPPRVSWSAQKFMTSSSWEYPSRRTRSASSRSTFWSPYT